MKHFARTMDFDRLLVGLREAINQGLVKEKDGPDELRMYCYTEACQYDRAWTPFSSIARGLILDHASKQVIATPFPKFFNLSEKAQSIPDMPFDIYEKVDGSLIIMYAYQNQWRAATKGSFFSEQAKWAKAYIDNWCDPTRLIPGNTYLAEAIYPENRIVVRYDEAGLVMLGGYDEAGFELSRDTIVEAAQKMSIRATKQHHFNSISDLVTHAKSLPATEEGFVLRFTDGTRLKVKGDEYLRIHALITRCTPLAMWEAMLTGDDMVSIRKDLPEKFWPDFDAITLILSVKLEELVQATAWYATLFSDKSDKELGLAQNNIPDPMRALIFPYRKGNGDLYSGRARNVLFKMVRPTGNVLEGYTPSTSMHKVMDELS